jgi:hypothetical protein
MTFLHVLKNRMVAASTTSSNRPQHEMLIVPSLDKPWRNVGTRNKEPRSRAYATRPLQPTSLAETLNGKEMMCFWHVLASHATFREYAQQATRAPSVCDLITSANRSGCMSISNAELPACLSARKNVLPPNNCKIKPSLLFFCKRMLLVLFGHRWLLLHFCSFLRARFYSFCFTDGFKLCMPLTQHSNNYRNTY